MINANSMLLLLLLLLLLLIHQSKKKTPKHIRKDTMLYLIYHKDFKALTLEPNTSYII